MLTERYGRARTFMRPNSPKRHLGTTFWSGTRPPKASMAKAATIMNKAGGNGDTFIFNAGYGQLEINEVSNSLTANNVLKFGTGIDPSQVMVSGDSSGDVILTIGSGGDQITIDKMLDLSVSGPQYGVQAIEFADGTVWTPQIVFAKQAANTDYTESLVGTAGADVFAPTSGNVYERGDGGGDSFGFDAGDGQLEINEGDASETPSNTLIFGAGITPSDIAVTGDGAGDIVLTDGTSGDKITIDNMLDSAEYGVQSVQFAGGTTWSQSDLLAREMTGSTGNDTIYGTNGADTLDGQGGNDVEWGKGGGDTFVFNAGYGHLEINEADVAADPDNVLQLGAGITTDDVTVSADAAGDVILTIGTGGDEITLDGMLSSNAHGVQEVQFASGTIWDRAQILDLTSTGTTGNDTLYGTSGAETFDGEGGNDVIQGNGGGDTVVFDPGYGHLEVNETDSSASPDNVLQLGSGIAASDLAVTADSSGNVYLTDGTSGDQIKIDNMLNAAHDGIQQIAFADCYHPGSCSDYCAGYDGHDRQ